MMNDEDFTSGALALGRNHKIPLRLSSRSDDGVGGDGAGPEHKSIVVQRCPLIPWPSLVLLVGRFVGHLLPAVAEWNSQQRQTRPAKLNARRSTVADKISAIGSGLVLPVCGASGSCVYHF